MKIDLDIDTESNVEEENKHPLEQQYKEAVDKAPLDYLIQDKKNDEECLVEMDKYLPKESIEEVNDTDVIMPAFDLDFDNELLQKEDSFSHDKESSVDEDKENKILDKLHQLDLEEITNIDNEDFQKEFSDVVTEKEAPKVRYVETNKIPFFAIFCIIIIFFTITLMLALLMVQLYNVPVPKSVENILNKFLA